MGYCTQYTLSVHEGNKGISEILAEETEETFAGLWYAINDEGDCVDGVKWYDHDDDVKALSKRNPGVVFMLYGGGEEAGDVWATYFKDGKSQYCPAQITFEPFDEEKLR